MSISPSAEARVSLTPSFDAKRGAECRTVAMLPLDRSGAPNLPLQLHHAIKQRFGSRWATRHVDVYRHDAIATAHDTVAVVIVTAAVSARPHRDHVLRI